MRFNWGTGVAAVYTGFALATIGFVVFAMEQPVELVSSDYYQASLRHDDRMAAVRNVLALGDRFSCRLDETRRTLQVALPSDAPGLVQGEITFYRPSDSAADRTFTLRPDADGHQTVDLSGLETGRWRLQIDWRVGGTPYYHERVLDLP
jgi:nitrogen fixation protein FixH